VVPRPPSYLLIPSGGGRISTAPHCAVSAVSEPDISIPSPGILLRILGMLCTRTPGHTAAPAWKCVQRTAAPRQISSDISLEAICGARHICGAAPGEQRQAGSTPGSS
jgi:hypothetical protein